MVRSRCTPIKLQISTHRSLSPTQRSLKADLSLCLCHQCSDLENLDQKSENLPCSTTRESMLIVPAKRGEKVLPLKMLVEWNNWAWYWHRQKLCEFVVDYAPVDCCAPKLSSLRNGITSRCKLQLELGEHNSLKPSCRTPIKFWLPGCHLGEMWWPWEPNQ